MPSSAWVVCLEHSLMRRGRKAPSSLAFPLPWVSSSAARSRGGPHSPQPSLYRQHTCRSFPVSLGSPGQTQFHRGFSSPNLMPGCSDSSSVFLTGYLSLLPPSLGFHLVFELVQDPPVHPYRLSGVPAQLCHWDVLLPSLEEVILEY